jgi:hypothetical protein
MRSCSMTKRRMSQRRRCAHGRAAGCAWSGMCGKRPTNGVRDGVGWNSAKPPHRVKCAPLGWNSLKHPHRVKCAPLGWNTLKHPQCVECAPLLGPVGEVLPRSGWGAFNQSFSDMLLLLVLAAVASAQGPV